MYNVEVQQRLLKLQPKEVWLSIFFSLLKWLKHQKKARQTNSGQLPQRMLLSTLCKKPSVLVYVTIRSSPMFPDVLVFLYVERSGIYGCVIAAKKDEELLFVIEKTSRPSLGGLSTPPLFSITRKTYFTIGRKSKKSQFSHSLNPFIWSQWKQVEIFSSDLNIIRSESKSEVRHFSFSIFLPLRGKFNI